MDRVFFIFSKCVFFFLSVFRVDINYSFGGNIVLQACRANEFWSEFRPAKSDTLGSSQSNCNMLHICTASVLSELLDGMSYCLYSSAAAARGCLTNKF